MESVVELRTQLRLLLRNLGVLQARYPELGLGVTQCHALLELEATSLTVGELSKRLQIEASSASRNMKTLARHGLAEVDTSTPDSRVKAYQLTAFGNEKVALIHERGNRVIHQATEYMTSQECESVWQGISVLEKAVSRSNASSLVTFRASTPRDDAGIAHVIRTVLAGLDMAREGTAYFEPQTDCIHETYAAVDGFYLVVEQQGQICGGGGIYPHSSELCELKNMYFLNEIRGGGHGRRLMNMLLRFAQERAFKEIFLETNSDWKAALHLYQQFGFVPSQPPDFYGCHVVCDRFFSLKLNSQ